MNQRDLGIQQMDNNARIEQQMDRYNQMAVGGHQQQSASLQSSSNNQLEGATSSDNRTQSQEEIIRITIDLGNNRAENIIVLKGQEKQSNELARAFCEKHGFQNIQAALAKQIQMNIDQILQQAPSDINDDVKSYNSPNMLPNEEVSPAVQSNNLRTEEAMKLNKRQSMQNIKTLSESIEATQSGRDQDEKRQ